MEIIKQLKSLCIETILDWPSNDKMQEFEKADLLEEAAMHVVFINSMTENLILVVGYAACPCQTPRGYHQKVMQEVGEVKYPSQEKQVFY